MSKLACQILKLQRLGDNATPEDIAEVDALLDPVRGWILWLRDEFGPDHWDKVPSFAEGAGKLAPIVELIIRTPDEAAEHFIKTNQSTFDGVNTQEYMDQVRERD